LYCPYFVYLRLLITPLVYFGHCIVRISSIDGFWLLLGIFWSLYCPYIVYLQLLITPLVYFVIVLSVFRLFTASNYPFGIFLSLYCPYFVFLRLLITPLIYVGHCIVRTSSIYGFRLPLWYIVLMVLFVLPLFTASDYLFGIFCVILLFVFRWVTASDYPVAIFWSLYCPYFVYLWLLITPLVYFGHCIVRISSIYGFWLLLWYILVIVLSVRRLFTASDYPFGIFWSLFCPYFFYLRLMITPLVYFVHCVVHTSSINGFWIPLWNILVIVLSVLRLFTASDYSFGKFWSLYCPYFVCLRLLITRLVSFGHCFVRTSSIYGFWLLHWYILSICIVHTSSIYGSDYSFVCFGHYIVRTSSIYGFWLLLWYILVFVLSVLSLFTAFDYSFDICWSLYCPYFVYLWVQITSLVYFADGIVRTSFIYSLWLPLWYILVIVLSVLRLFTTSDYFFVYFGHCIVRTSSIYGFWLLLWYILVIVLSILLLFTAYNYSFSIFCPLHCPYFVYLRLLITPLVYFGHCIFRTSSIYGLWLLL